MKRRGRAAGRRRGILYEEGALPGKKVSTAEVISRAALAVDHVLARHASDRAGRIPPWRVLKGTVATARRGYAIASSPLIVRLAHEVLCEQTGQPCVQVLANGRWFDVVLKLFEGHAFASKRGDEIIATYVALTGALSRPKPVSRGRRVARPGVCQHPCTMVRLGNVTARVKDALLDRIGELAWLAQAHDEVQQRR